MTRSLVRQIVFLFAVAASIVFGVSAAACTAVKQPVHIDAPVRSGINTSGFRRVYVAGFLGGGSSDVDLNEETVRVFRSQLRQRGFLNVVEADPLPLAEVAALNPGAIRTEHDAESHDAVFSDVAYWRDVGEEHPDSLIVTGIIVLRQHSVALFGSVDRPLFSLSQQVGEGRSYRTATGYVLHERLVFIDGRTGGRLKTQSLQRSAVYDQTAHVPPLSAYFDLVDRLLPQFLSTVATTTVRVERVLLR